MSKKLLSEGYRVFGSVRSQQTAESLGRELGDGFTPLLFDICNEEQLDAARDQLAQLLGEGQLDALINNAGSAEMGPLLHLPLEAFRRQLDTLVVGHLAVIQRFHPFLLPRKANGTAGRIINISSTSGVSANPLFGVYCAGKHALEGLSKSLRQELERFGISVLVIAPGNIQTELWQKQTTELVARYAGTEYHDTLVGLLAQIRGPLLEQAMTADEFAQAFYEIFTLPTPADRYTVKKGRPSRLSFTSRPTVQWFED